MNFTKLAFSLAIVDALSKSMEKQAVLGAIASGAGKAGMWAVRKSQKSMGNVLGPVSLGLGALGAGAAVKSGIQQGKAGYHGFNPALQNYALDQG